MTNSAVTKKQTGQTMKALVSLRRFRSWEVRPGVSSNLKSPPLRRCGWAGAETPEVRRLPPTANAAPHFGHLILVPSESGLGLFNVVPHERQVNCVTAAMV